MKGSGTILGHSDVLFILKTAIFQLKGHCQPNIIVSTFLNHSTQDVFLYSNKKSLKLSRS